MSLGPARYRERFCTKRSVSRQRSNRSDLLIHLHEIEVVPGFDKFAVFDSGNRDARELDRQLRRFVSQTVALVTAVNTATRRNQIAFTNLIFYDDHDVGKGFAELRMEWQKPGGAAQSGLGYQ